MSTLYDEITNKVIAKLETAGDYDRPWIVKGLGFDLPKNAATKARYNGINILFCLWAQEEKGYGSAHWATYKQWQELGAQVRQGEKSTKIVYFGQHERENDNGDKEAYRFLKSAPVFNADQVDGWKAEPAPQVILTPFERLATVEAAIAATGAAITYQGDRAFYAPSRDQIVMPKAEQFRDQEAFYAVLLHELTHWTGTESRCNRTFGKRFGDHAYAMEELVAEMGAAFLCGILGISAEPRQDHASYLAHWLKVLKSDNRAILTAASAASKAADHILAYRKQAQALAA